jgi:uncharacterized protein (DUF2062 family)
MNPVRESRYPYQEGKNAGIFSFFKKLFREKFYKTLIHSPHPPEFIARGAAVGTFIAMTPTFGFQIALSIAVWYMGKITKKTSFSLPVAIAMTWITNYFTVLPYYFIAYLLGAKMGNFFFSIDAPVNYLQFKLIWLPAMSASFWEFFVELWRVFLKIGIPLLLGSLPFAIILSIIAYPFTLNIVKRERAIINAFVNRKK